MAERAAGGRGRGAAGGPVFWALGVAAAGLAVAPWVWHEADVHWYWKRWSEATAGWRPWGAYARRCNYPPFLPLLLAALEAVRRGLGLSFASRVWVLLVKIPSILAHAAGVALCWRGLRRVWGERWARRAAIAYALCAALFVNAAVWGQWEALLSLGLVAALVAAINRRAIAAGIAAGWAVSLKLQAGAAAPTLLVYARRRGGLGAAAAAVASAAVTLAVVALPYVTTGNGRRVLDAYIGAMDAYPRRTQSAYNFWYLLVQWEHRFRGVGSAVVNDDWRPWICNVTSKQVGLEALGWYWLALMVALWRRPSRYALVLTTGMSCFGFFMLATQIHERYLAPAAAVLAMAAPRSRRTLWLYAGVCATATVNQLLELWLQNAGGTVQGAPLRAAELLAIGVAAINAALFVWGNVLVWREARRRPRPRAVRARALGGSAS